MVRNALLLALLALAAPVLAQGAAGGLASLSLEELMEVEVSLVSRHEEPLFGTAAAVTVITGDDIRRSGATCLPEALRLVPGMQVARIDANKWAVSARGFADRFSQKLLVLIDGRSVYSPIFAGVFWEIQDLLLEDVERIEVIRGPGATLWGANAMNGIVNIVTRSSADTGGALLVAGAGTQERGLAALRYGGRLGRHGHFRIDAKGFERDAFANAAGQEGADDWRMSRTGLRADWERGPDRLMVQGALFVGRAGQTYRYPALEEPLLRTLAADTDLWGGHAMARWQRTVSARSDLRLQLYHDRDARRDPVGDTDRSTWDVDFQHRGAWSRRHESTWGLGYRSAFVDARGTPLKVTFDPEESRTDLFSAFVQHRVQLTAALHLSAGTKLEHNDFTGFEYQPGMRGLWRLSPRRALWVSATRAVRTPALADDRVRIRFRSFPLQAVLPGSAPEDPPLQTHLVGTGRFQSEVLHSAEAGYRQRLGAHLLVDVAAFRNRYADLRSGVHRPLQPTLVAEPVPHFLDQILIVNAMAGTTWGWEAAVDWQLPEGLGRARGAYATTRIDLEVDPGAAPQSVAVEGGTPQHQASLWSSLNLRHDLQVDAIARYVGAIRDRPGATRPRGTAPLPFQAYLPYREIDAYLELDLRLEWRASRDLRLAIAGRNLLHDRHAESADLFIDTEPTLTQRCLHATLTWSHETPTP